MSRQRNRVAVLAAFLALSALVFSIGWSFTHNGIVRGLLSSQHSAAEKVALLRNFLDQFGPAAPLVYLLFVIVEVVVAPIPGTMLYAPGGVLFGGFWGGMISLAGNVIGAGIACVFARTLLGGAAQRWFDHSALKQYEQSITERGGWIVFLLRVNPLTSSDIVSYAAGLTHMSVWQLMLGTAAGMAPLCFVQSYLSEGLLAAFPKLLYPLAGACAVYAVVVIGILARMASRREPAPTPDVAE